jgi:osmoprotectant transport system substrate-binding protein
MHFWRKPSLASLLLVCVALLAACGGGQTATAPAAPTTAPAAPTAAPKAAAPTTTSAAPTTAPAAATAAPKAAATTAPVAATAAPAAATSPAAAAKPATSGAPIKIGSKDFTEQFILGEIYAQLLEANGFKVERKLNLGATQVAQAALLKGDIDLYPEYTGTGLTVVLGRDPLSDRKATYDAVVAGYKPLNLTWLDTAPMNNTQAVAMKKDRAAALGIKTLSDLSKQAPNLTAAFIPEFMERPDGLPGLKKVYGGFEFKDIKLVAIGVKYKALVDGDVDVTLAFGTDGQIAGYDLMTPVDDKNLWPPYQVAPVVRNDTLTANPTLAPLLNSVAPKLNDATMQRLNWEVDGKKREPADVAKEFLTQEGLIKK